MSLGSCVGVRWSIQPPPAPASLLSSAPSLPAPVKSDCWQGPCYKLATHLSLSLRLSLEIFNFPLHHPVPVERGRWWLDWEDKQVSSNLNVKPGWAGGDKYSVRVIICPLESVGANNWQHAIPGRSDWWSSGQHQPSICRHESITPQSEINEEKWKQSNITLHSTPVPSPLILAQDWSPLRLRRFCLDILSPVDSEDLAHS